MRKMHIFKAYDVAVYEHRYEEAMFAFKLGISESEFYTIRLNNVVIEFENRPNGIKDCISFEMMGYLSGEFELPKIHPYTKKVFSAKEIQQEFIRGFGI